jgi:hypothetical protein
MAENMDICDFEFTTDQMARITRMDTGALLFLDNRHPEAVEQDTEHPPPCRRTGRCGA